MGEICKYVDVCIANEEDAADVFGIKAANTDVTTGTVNHEGYKDVAKQLADRLDSRKLLLLFVNLYLQMITTGLLCYMTELTTTSAKNTKCTLLTV